MKGRIRGLLGDAIGTLLLFTALIWISHIDWPQSW